MISFIGGFIGGVFVGVVVMCLLQIVNDEE